MLSTLRRCPTSIRWRLVSTALKSNPLSSPASIESPDLALRKPSSLFLSVRQLHQSVRASQYASAARVAYEDAVESEQPPLKNGQYNEAANVGPATKFAQLAERKLIDESIIRTLTQKMGLETMTQVQTLTIAEALKGKDVLAQAKTGTGKTIGFLLPVIQKILDEDPSLSKMGRKVQPRFGERASDIRAIIISPTRELAEQIGEEARKMLQSSSIVVQTAVGGTQKGMHMRNMQREGCHILVGTPGRLKDILSDRQSGVQAPKLSALVLDEADRLLDQGFWPEIQAIQDLLPSQQEKSRQTFMFSATVSSEVVKLVRTVMKPDLHYVRTVQDNEEPTHERVKQMLVTVPGLENLLPTLLELCQREVEQADRQRPFKAIVYFNTTAEVTLASSVFFNIRRESLAMKPFMPDTRIYEIHSRLTQSQRTAAAGYFRQATSAILMSSDVTARGMDFPGVTHVIQVGLPQDRDVYVHRLGRTARAGQEGEGWLLITDGVRDELRQRLGHLPLQKDTSIASTKVDYENAIAGEAPAGLTDTAQKAFAEISNAVRKIEPEELEETYLALLGGFQWVRDKKWLIASMNRLTKVSWGMERPPSISRGLAMKLGLTNIPGVNFGGGARGAFGVEGGRSPRRFDEDMDRDEQRPPRRDFDDRNERPARGGRGDRGDRSTSFSSRGRVGGDRRERSNYGDRSDRGSSFGGRDERTNRGGSGFGARRGGFGGGGDRERGGFGGGDRERRASKY